METKTLYLYTGLALRWPTILDYEARTPAGVIPAGSVDAARDAAMRILSEVAPACEGWGDHRVGVQPLVDFLPEGVTL